MKSNAPLVSIILPCYNAERTISRTLDDIFHQTHDHLEVICVDDGSTDNTRNIIKERTEPIIFLSQTNKGASAARNAGFKASHGEFVLFCDADVQLDRSMVEKMLSTLTHHTAAAYCYSNFKFGPHSFDLFPFDAIRLQKENYISTMSLIRRDKFIGFDESLKRFQDWDLWKRLLANGDQGVWCPERLFSAPMQGGISKFSWKNIAKLLLNRLKY